MHKEEGHVVTEASTGGTCRQATEHGTRNKEGGWHLPEVRKRHGRCCVRASMGTEPAASLISGIRPPGFSTRE